MKIVAQYPKIYLLIGFVVFISVWAANLADVDAQGSEPPAIVTQTPSQEVLWGQPFTLSVTATGSLPLQYNWYKGAVGDTTTPITGNTAEISVSPMGTTSYWVRVSNAVGTVDSAAIVLSVPQLLTCNVQQVTNAGEFDIVYDALLSGDGNSIIYYRKYAAVGVNEVVRYDLTTQLETTLFQFFAGEQIVTPSQNPIVVSNDSSTIIFAAKDYRDTDPDPYVDLYLWREGIGVEKLTDSISSITYEAFSSLDIADDGSRFVFITNENVTGNNANRSDEIFLWDEMVGFVQLTNMDSSILSDNAVISGDGTRIAVSTALDLTGTSPSGTDVFLWEDNTGFFELPQPAFRAEIADMNSDGTTIISHDDILWREGETTIDYGFSTIYNTLSATGTRFVGANSHVELLDIYAGFKRIISGNVTDADISSDGNRIIFQATSNLLGYNFYRKANIYLLTCDNRPMVTSANNGIHFVTSGGTTTMSVNVDSNSLYTVQWYQGIAGDTSTPVGTESTSLVVSAVTEDADYWVRVINATGTSDTGTLRLRVSRPPVITDQPTTVSASYLDPITVTVTVDSVSPNPLYQWYIGESGDTSQPIFSTTSRILSTNATQASYWLQVSNSFGTTNSATIYIAYPVAVPVINSINASPNPIEYGYPLTLSADVVSEGSTTYQWAVYNDETFSYDIVGTTNPLVLTALPSLQAYPYFDMIHNYRLQVTNEGGLTQQFVNVEVIPAVVNTCSIQQLTHNNSDELYPRTSFISGDGSRVLITYESYPYLSTADLLEIRDVATGAVIMSIEDGLYYGLNGLNADGSRALFQSIGNYTGQNADANFELFLWNEASGFTQLTNRTSTNPYSGIAMSAVSDSGQVVAYVANFTPNGQSLNYYDILLWQQGVGTRRLLSSPVASDGYGTVMALSGNGNAIAYLSDANPLGQNADGNFELFLWRRNLPLQQLTQTTGEHLAQVMGDALMTINYNGTRIAFNSEGNLTGQNPTLIRQVFLWEAGKGIRQLTFDATHGTYVISMNSQGDRITGSTRADLVTGRNLDHSWEVFYWTENVGWSQVTSTFMWELQWNDISADGRTIVFNNYLPDITEEVFIASCPGVPTPPLAPSSPTSGATTANSIALNWQDNSTSETTFIVERSDDGTNWIVIGTVGANVSTFTDTTVACSTAYKYRIRAYNESPGAYSAYSAPATLTSGACPPMIVPVLALGTVTDLEVPMEFSNIDELATDIRIEYSANGQFPWHPLATLDVMATTYTDNLLCEQTRHYRVRAYRSNDNAYSASSNVIQVTMPDCPALAQPPAPTLLRVERILAQLTVAADTSGEVDTIHLERSSNGIDWQSISSVGSLGGTVVDSTLVCNSPYSYRVRTYRQHDAEFSPPSDVVLVFTTSCPTPVIHTVGVFKDGLWLFSDVNDTSTPDIRVQFGPNESGWTALTGDWDGDDVDGIGLYKNGVFLLRNVTVDGVGDMTFSFGPTEAGWQPIVGDWNGDDIVSIGVYKDGVFILRDSNSAGDADYRFRLGDGTAGWIALSGDWDGSGGDTVGLYRAGYFYLTNVLDGSGLRRPFLFGPTQSGWLPITADWNADGVTTVGVFSQSIWRLRDSNEAGTVDLGFNFGAREAGWQPIASYQGGSTPLMILAQMTGGHPVVTEISAATELPVEITPEVTPQTTLEVTAEVTEVVTVEATAVPEVTAEAPMIPTAIEEPTFEPTTASPEAVEVTPEVSAEPHE